MMYVSRTYIHFCTTRAEFRLSDVRFHVIEFAGFVFEDNVRAKEVAGIAGIHFMMVKQRDVCLGFDMFRKQILEVRSCRPS